MEASLRMLLQKTLGEYIAGGFGSLDVSRFPLQLRDLKLNEKKIQEDMDEDGGIPFELSSGTIGSISVNPGWLGTVEVCATNVVLNFSFSAVRAMNWAMKPPSQDEEQLEPAGARLADRDESEVPCAAAPAPGPPAPVAPRFCTSHDRSDKRTKLTQPKFQECSSCHTSVQTSYADITLCPVCSDRHQCCMICGSSAPTSNGYIPAQTLDPQAAGPAMQGGPGCRSGGEEAPAPRAASGEAPGGSRREPPRLPLPRETMGETATASREGMGVREPPRLPPPREEEPEPPCLMQRPERPTPSYCSAHGTSESRRKAEVRLRACAGCRVEYRTSYVDFTLCPVCSDAQGRCVICGAPSSRAGTEAQRRVEDPPIAAGAGTAPPLRPATPRDQGISLEAHEKNCSRPFCPLSPGDQHMGVYGAAIPKTLSNCTIPCETTREVHGEHASSSRPFPQGGWRDSIATMQLDAQRKSQQAGFAPLYSSNDMQGFNSGSGLFRLLNVFDVGSWGQCMSQNSMPRSACQEPRQSWHNDASLPVGPGQALPASAPAPLAANVQRFGGA